jgi:hypothetical protein
MGRARRCLERGLRLDVDDYEVVPIEDHARLEALGVADDVL